MGIQGLLPFLKGIQRDVHVSSFRGRKVAVDGYCWLHKGAYSCAFQLVMKTEKLETLPFIKYCMKRVNMLLRHDITPVMVFDGSYLPLKAATENERRERRQLNLQRGKELLKEGRKSEAVDCFQRSVDVSPEMALALIKECRSAGVECIVAPYEADSQLAYLCKEEIVDFVITEDSDLLVFGCGKVLFKLDDAGNGKLIEIDQLGKANHGLVGFTIDSFRHMCILSGCDYLASVPGIGLGKALKLMKRFNKDPYRVIKALRHENGKVPGNYEENFRKADHTFLYQVVFDPCTQSQVRLNPLPGNVYVAEFEFAGISSSPRKAVGMARGNINPLNYAVMDTYSPSKAPPPKSRSRGGSVMGGNVGWGRSADSQPPSSLSSSDSSRKHFKPPKKLKPKPVINDEDEVKDEDLQNTYLTASMAPSTTLSTTGTIAATAAQEVTSLSSVLTEVETDEVDGRTEQEVPTEQPVLKSRFFAGGAVNSMPDETPSDLEVTSKLRAKRRLALMPPELGNTRLRLSPSPSRDAVLETPTQSEVEEETPPGGRGRKRHSSDSQQGVRAKLWGFQYSSCATKKVKCDNDSSPLSQLDQDLSPTSVRARAPTVSPSPVKNPFAKSKTSLRRPPLITQDSSEGDDTETGQPTMEGLSTEESAVTHTPVVPGVAGESCIQSLQPSTDPFSTGPSVTPSTPPSATAARGRSFMTSEDFITKRPHTLLNHVITLAQSDSGADNHSSGHPKFTSQERVLGNSGKRKGRTKAVSKASVNSKFKAPKRSVPSGQGGLRQLNLLSQFGYCSRPQMTREQ